MLIGMARTSTIEQVAGLEAQVTQLKDYGCEKIYKEQVSSVGEREQLNIALGSLRSGDKLVVTKLDRLARSVKHLGEIIEIVNKALFKDLKLNKKKIVVVSFSSLTTDLCKKYKSNIILRGLRAVSDFEYEFQLAGMNKKLNSNIETMFLMSDVENQIISSKFVKEIASLGGNIDRFVTKSTVKVLKNNF